MKRKKIILTNIETTIFIEFRLFLFASFDSWNEKFPNNQPNEIKNVCFFFIPLHFFLHPQIWTYQIIMEMNWNCPQRRCLVENWKFEKFFLLFLSLLFIFLFLTNWIFISIFGFSIHTHDFFTHLFHRFLLPLSFSNTYMKFMAFTHTHVFSILYNGFFSHTHVNRNDEEWWFEYKNDHYIWFRP